MVTINRNNMDAINEINMNFSKVNIEDGIECPPPEKVVFLGQTGCSDNIHKLWPQIDLREKSILDEIPMKLISKVLEGIDQKYYLDNKKTWNELATMDHTLYHTMVLCKYVPDEIKTNHSGTWYHGIVICSGMFENVCGFGKHKNRRDAESLAIRELLYNMLGNGKSQQADVEQPDVTEMNSTSVTAATEMPVEENQDEAILGDVGENSTEPVFVPKQLTERIVQLDNLAWTTSGINGQSLKVYVLPRALTATQASLCDSLIMAQWRLNRMQRINMVVTFLAPAQIQLNGQLFAKFFYGASADRDVATRFNEYSMTHGRHVAIRAGAKSSSRLVIPFNNEHRMMVNQISSFETISALNLGYLVIAVNAPLTGPDGVTPRIDISVQISFESEMAGRIGGDMYALPTDMQQQGLISDVVNSDAAAPIVSTVEDVEKIFHAMRTTKDEDKPMNPLIRTVVVPRYMETMSAGTNIDDQCLPMRLDVKGKKPSTLRRSGNEIKGMLRDKALFKKFVWSTTQPRGTLLLRIPVEAVSGPDVYEDVEVGTPEGVVIGKAVPPCDVVASMFNYTSGSLEYEFEAIGTIFHTGALAVVIVPLADEDLITPNFNSLNNVKREIFELGKQMQNFVVTSDYHNKNPVIGTRSGNSRSVTPRRSMGQLMVFVNTALQTTAAQSITVNVYKRGAPDFEVVEFKNAIMCPVFDAPILYNPQSFIPEIDAQTNFFMSFDNEIFSGNKMTFAYSLIGDSIGRWDVPGREYTFARWVGFNPTTPVPGNTTTISGFGYLYNNTTLPIADDDARRYVFRVVILLRYRGYRDDKMVAFPLPEGFINAANTAIIPLSTLLPNYATQLQSALETYQRLPSDENRTAVRAFLLNSAGNSAYLNIGFSTSTEVGLSLIGDQYLGTSLLEQQGDTGANQVASGSQNSKNSVKWGQTIFGEQGGEIQALLRRPWYLGTFTYNPRRNLPWPNAHVSLQVSHWTQPRNYTDPVHFANRWSSQSLLMTAYTFVAGSVSHRIKGTRIPGTTMWCNFEPFNKPNVSVNFLPHNNVANSPVYTQSNAVEWTDLTINSHMNINFPWKNENLRNFCFEREPTTDDPSYQTCFDLGLAHIGFESSDPDNAPDANYSFSVYRAFGDDAELSLYRGFPPMVFNQDLEESLSPIDPPATLEQQGVGEKVSDLMASAIRKTIDVDAEIGKIRGELVSSSQASFESTKKEVLQQLEDLKKTLSADIQLKGFNKLRDLMAGELIHFIAHPDARSVVATVINILVQFGLFTYDTSSEFKNAFESILTDSSIQPDTEDDEVKSQQGDEIKNDMLDKCEGIVAILLTAVCSYIGYTSPTAKSMDWKMKLAFAIPSMAGMAFSLKRFMHILLPLLKWCFEYCIGLKAKYVDDVFAGFMAVNSSLVGNWIAEVNKVCVTDFDLSQIVNRDRIYLAHNIAIVLEKRVLNNTARFNAIKPYVKKIHEKWNEVEKSGLTPGVRKEPFSIWMYGPAGVGKSTVINSIVSKLVVDNNIEVPNGEMTLTASATSKYLNRVAGQPELRIDDFMAVNSPEIAAAQVAYVFEVMTSASYIPNQAAVEDKSRLYSPAFFTILSNVAYPTNIPINNPEAFLRRRNITVHVEGDYASLKGEYEEEFVEALAACRGIYGELPAKMKENFKHLRFSFVKVESNFSTTTLKIGGKTYHNFTEFQKLVADAYKMHDKIKTASYQTRLGAFYAARGCQIPDFSTLLESSELDLEFAIQRYIAESEGDNDTLDRLDKLFDVPGAEAARAKEVWEKTIKSASLSSLLKTFYGKQQQGNNEEKKKNKPSTSGIETEKVEKIEEFSFDSSCITRDKFLSEFNRNLRPAISVAIAMEEERYTEGSVYLYCTPKGEYIPAIYHLLSQAKCAHCIAGKSTAEIAQILDTEDCVSNCWLPYTLRKEAVCHFALCVSNDKTWLSKMTMKLAKYTGMVKNWFVYAKEQIQRAVKWLWTKIKIIGVPILDFFKRHWKMTLAITAALTAMVGVLWSYNEEECYMLKVMPDGMLKTKTGNIIRAGKSGLLNLGSTLGICDQQAYNEKIRTTVVNVKEAHLKNQQGDPSPDLFRIISEAFVPVICTMKSGWSGDLWKTSMFVYSGRMAIMTRHEYEIMSQFATEVRLVMVNKKGADYCIPLRPEDLHWEELKHYGEYNVLRKGNFGIIRLPKNVPQRRSLITPKHSWFQDESTVNGFNGALISPLRPGEDGLENIVFLVDYNYLQKAERTVPAMVNGRQVTTSTIYADNYYYPISKRGYCLGALVDIQSGKIVGFHYAGDSACGVAERVLTKYFPQDEFVYENMPLKPANESFDNIDGIILPLGHSDIKHQQSSVSKIRKSLIHGVVDVTTAPAKLICDDWSPLYEGVSKHGRPPKNFPAAWVEEAFHDYKYVLRNATPIFRDTRGELREMTTSEAIFGIEGMINSLDVTTSCGFGWQGCGPGKKGLVNLDRKWVAPRLLLAINDMEMKFQNGIIPFVLAVDCLKDETLPLEKIEKVGHTRIISTMPVEYQVILRKYFMPFIVSYHAYNFETEHAIGICVSGMGEMQFDRLGKMMEGSIVAGDFKNFGPGANAVVAQKCLDAVYDWYKFFGASDLFLKTYRAVVEPLICTPHLAYDKVYRTCSGIVSGSAVTVDLNSMIHSMYMRIASIGMGIPLDDFHREVRLITYGDDGLMKVSDFLRDKFNVATLRDFFAGYNIIYTSVDKTDNIVPYTSLAETSFLKHSFIKYDGQYMAALDRKSIENQVNWISKEGDPKINTVVNCENALRQAYTHGATYYNELREKIMDGLIRRRIFVSFPNYATAKMRRYEVTTGEQDISMYLRSLVDAKTKDIVSGYDKKPVSEAGINTIAQAAYEAGVNIVGRCESNVDDCYFVAPKNSPVGDTEMSLDGIEPILV